MYSTSRASMDFDNEQHGVPGGVPEYGAVFMSNSATKRECFRRRLFGLPASQGPFVKQVKAGMILFLFEYEKRKLYGVFQACSDGAENIVPHAFCSSGKQFPAQVTFTPIWHCSPLTEADFCDAIKENYFSANKFNFGLSEEQVRRLLCLFSLRKVTDDLPQKQPNKIKVASACTMVQVMRFDDGGVVMNDKVKDRDDSDDYHRPILLTEDPRESSDYVGRERDECRFAKSHWVGNKSKVYNERGPVTMNEYLGDSLATVGRDGGRFSVCERSGSECTLAIEHGPVMSNDHSGFLLGAVRQVPDNGRFAMTNRLECEHNMDDGFVPSFSTECPSIFQPNLNRSIYSNKPIWETDSVVQDQLRPHSTFSRAIEPQISYPSHSTLYGDAIGMSTRPFDHDIAGINSRHSSSSGIDHSSNSLQECSPPYGTYARNLIPSPENQSYFPSIGPNCIKRCPDDSSGFGNHVPFSTHNHNENFFYRPSMPFSGAYSENLTTKFSENQGFKGLSFSWCTSAPVPLSETGNSGSENKGPSYSSSCSIYPSFNFDYGFPVESQRKLEHEGVRKEEKNQEFTGNIPLSNKGEVQLHGCDDSLEHRSVHHHERKSLNHDLNCDQYSENKPSGCEKSRNGVFSRLALVSDVYEQENGDDVGHEECDGDKSADEVMAMLNQSCHQWEKTKKSSIYSFNFDYGFPVESQGKLEHEGVRLEEKKESFTCNTPLSNKGQVQLHGCDYSLEQRGVRHHVPKSLNHDLNRYKYSESMSSGCEKSRNSVFSRLALASDAYVQENGDDVGHEECDGDKSADEVMAMLHQSRCQWEKTRCQWEKTKKSRSLFKGYDVKNFGNKKQPNFYPKLEGDRLEMNLQVMKMNSIPTVEKNVNQTVGGTPVDLNYLSAGGTPYVDFKRRSVVRKNCDDTKSRVCDDIAGGDGSSVAQRKRKRLIRPNFSKSPDVLSQGSSCNGKDKNESCEALVGSQDKENKLSQSVELLHVICPISGEDKNINIDVERGSNCGESKAGNREAFFGVNRKESSQDAGIHSTCEDKIHNAEDGLGIKDPMGDQLSLGCLIPATLSSQSFIEREEENAFRGTVNGDIQHQKKLPQCAENANELCPVNDEIAIGDTMNSLSNQISTIRRVPEEFIDISVDEDKRNNQQLASGSIATPS